MNKLFPLSLVLCACFTLLNVQAQPAIRKVLFLGNSYTYVNDLPHIIASIASSMGDSLFYDSNTPGGWTLDQHAQDSVSTAKIMTGGWDYVVLQEQSQLPAWQEYDGFGATSLCFFLREYNPCARTMFYMTWGRKNGDQLNCPVWPPVCTYSGMDSLLRLRYVEMASTNEAELSPVGAVWRYIKEHYPSIELYQSDGSHPTLAGSYLAGCCFYTSLFKKNPLLIPYNAALTTDEATAIKEATKMIVFDSLQFWNFENYTPTADFSYTIGTGVNEIVCTNTSTNASSYLWDFGDGTTSTVTSPVHHYSSEGSYTITLTAVHCDLLTTYQAVKKMGITFCAHNPTITPDNLILCPSDTSDTLWTQVYDAYQWFDDNGNPLLGETHQYLVPSGGKSYSVLATKDNCSEMSPSVFVNFYSNLNSYYVTAVGNFLTPNTTCAGDTIALILLPFKPPFPPEKNIQWFKDGVPIPSSHNDSLVVTVSGNYSVSVVHEYCPDFVVYQSDQLSYTFIECTLGVTEGTQQSSAIVYPNPAEDFAEVRIPSELIGTNYTMMDVLGRIIERGIFETERITVPMNDLQSGVYFLHIGHGQVIPFIKK